MNYELKINNDISFYVQQQWEVHIIEIWTNQQALVERIIEAEVLVDHHIPWTILVSILI